MSDYETIVNGTVFVIRDTIDSDTSRRAVRNIQLNNNQQGPENQLEHHGSGPLGKV